MNTKKEVLEYGLSFPDTYQDAPFRDDNWQLVRFKGNKKAFLWTYETKENDEISSDGFGSYRICSYQR